MKKTTPWELKITNSLFLVMMMMECYLLLLVEAAAVVQENKVESMNPIPTLSPPEGNTTFIDGTTWCVARAGVLQVDLQQALDWACGAGMADCSTIKSGGACFQPDTLLSHASYAFNNYYQQNGNSDIACNFGGTATVTKQNPSYGKCSYDTSGYVLYGVLIYRNDPTVFICALMGETFDDYTESERTPVSSSPPSKPTFICWELLGLLLLLLFLRS